MDHRVPTGEVWQGFSVAPGERKETWLATYYPSIGPRSLILGNLWLVSTRKGHVEGQQKEKRSGEKGNKEKPSGKK